MNDSNPTQGGGKRLGGMFDMVEWPEKLTARVVNPCPDPCIHGYAVESDLARHYSFSEVLYLTLVGELPSSGAARAFDAALTFLAVVPISDGASHAAALSRLCNAPPRAAIEVAAVALSERANFAMASHRDMFEWLARPNETPPQNHLACDDDESQHVARLRAVVPHEVELPPSFVQLTLPAALICVLHACGLRKEEQQHVAWTLAGLGAVFAEAVATTPLAFRQYPMNTPAFRYRGRDV